MAVEVKSAELRRAVLRRSARSFIEAYQPELFLVVNTGITHRESIGRTEVRWSPPAALSDQVAEAT